MPISNGVDISRVLPILSARRGFKQPTSSDFTPVLDTAAKTCVSGRYFNSEHSACSPNSIWKAQEDAGITDANFNTYLADLKNEVCMDALSRVFVGDALAEKPQITYEKTFRSGYITVPNTGRFVGIQLKIADGDFAVKLDSILLTMTKACNVTVYMFNDVRAAPLWTKQFAVTTGYDQTIFNLNTPDYTEIILRRLDSTHKGGMVWVGYFQDELEAQGANAADIYLNWWGDYMLVGYQSFEAVANYGQLTFQKDRYTSNYKSYGFNVELSGYHDYTNLIAAQPQAFDNLIGYMMAYKCIIEAMQSNRSNRDTRLGEENYNSLYDQLEGGSQGNKVPYQVAVPYKTGYTNKIENEIKRLQDTFYDSARFISGIPPVNLPQDVQNPQWGKLN
jgi:hypothetical protein